MALKVPSACRLRNAVLVPSLAATATSFPVFPRGRAEALVAVILGAPKPTPLMLSGGLVQGRDDPDPALSRPAGCVYTLASAPDHPSITPPPPQGGAHT